MADVFVSYARSDKVRVAPLVAAIEAQGWSVWWDPDINAGPGVRQPDRRRTAVGHGRDRRINSDIGCFALGSRRSA